MRFIRSRVFINIALLLSLFLISILVRLDNLKDPMGRHHEWLSGHVLSTVSVYETDGTATHFFAPVWTFHTPADRFANTPEIFKDKNNCTYYVSYPPLCFLLPHYLFKLCFTNASVIGLRVIGLINHFFIGFFIFLILLKLFDRSIKDRVFLPAVFAFALYTFAAGNLWFHGHVWFADMLVPLFITAFLYVCLRVLKNEMSTGKACLWLFVPAALGAYTEWQMLFVSFFASLVFFFMGLRDRRFFLYFLTICAATLLPVVLVYIQYSSIAGSAELMANLKAKYELRSGVHAVASEAGLGRDNSFSFENLSQHYERNYSTLLDFGWYALLIFAGLVIINRMLDKGAIKWVHFFLFAVILASILLHHCVFFNFTALHDFSTLKSSLFISLFCGYVLGLVFVIFDLFNKRKQRNQVIAISIAVFAVFFHFSTASYYKTNQKGTLDKRQEMIGEIVRTHIHPDEIVFSSLETTPETTWYAKRNIVPAKTTADAIDFLQLLHSPLYNGQWVKLNEQEYEVIKLNAKGDTLAYVKDALAHLDCMK